MPDLIYVSMTYLFESFFKFFLHDEKNMKLHISSCRGARCFP